ncbi:MAG: rod shape-determining protein MreC [Chitinophagaceae bacterium]|nr:rod shape-determining protein MreC [Chitinophagaceae bacterium]
MRNIFLFIRRYRTFFTFLILQGVALWFLFSYNKYHRAKFLGVANEITGRINTQYNKVEDYFTLKEENRRIHRLNDSLLNLLPRNFGVRDTIVQMVRDSVSVDTMGTYRRYYSRPAVVVYNTINSQKNYIQLNRGSSQGIRDNMAVVNSDGSVVGVVVNVSPNFSQAMSLLHVQNKVNASLKRSGDMGTIEWDGVNPQYLQLKGIPKSIDIKKGDTVLTSPYSFNFPPGYLVGTVAEIVNDKSTNFYVLKIKTGTNFYSLHQVHVLANTDYDEQTRLNKETKRRIEENKRHRSE